MGLGAIVRFLHLYLDSGRALQLTCFRAGGYEFVASTLSGPARRSSTGRSNASARAFSVLSLGVCFPFSNRTNVIRPSPAACARFS